MTIKKNTFTKFSWVLFVLLTFGMLLVTSNGIAERMGKSGDVLFIGISYFVILIAAEALYGLSLLLKKINFNEVTMPTDSDKFVELVYIIFVSVLLFMVRFIYLVTKGDDLLPDLAYYNLAINGDLIGANSISSLSFVYVFFLKYIFNNYSSSLSICMYIQAFLHVITFLCMYFTLKYLVNKKAAVVGSLLFSFLVYDIIDVANINPQSMYCSIFSIGLLLLVSSINLSYNKKLSIKNYILYFLFSGLFAGILAFLDYSGIVFFISGIVFIVLYRNHEFISKRYSWNYQLILFSVGAIIAFITCYLLKAYVLNINNISIIVNDYINIPNMFKINYMIEAPAYGTYLSAVLIGLSFLWLFRIWAIERDFTATIVLLTFGVVLLSFFSLSRDGYSNLITLLYSYLAAFGFASLWKNDVLEAEVTEVISEKDNKKDDNKIDSFKDLANITKELAEIKKKEKEAKMLNKNSGINTSLVNNSIYNEAEANLDFLKEKKNEIIEKKKEDKIDSKIEETRIEVSRIEETKIEEINTKNKEDISIVNKIDTLIESKAKDNWENIVNNTNNISSDIAIEKDNTNNNANIVSTNNDKTDDKVKLMNPTKFGRRMDYKTAIVRQTPSQPTNDENPSGLIFEVKSEIRSDSNKEENRVENKAENKIENKIENKVEDKALLNTNNVIKPVTLIKNPLPTPKKHVPREMDFDVIPAESDMHFDIVDLKDKDFFDIN